MECSLLPRSHRTAWSPTTAAAVEVRCESVAEALPAVVEQEGPGGVRRIRS